MLHGFNCIIILPYCPLCCVALTSFLTNFSFLFCVHSLLPGQIAEFLLHCDKSAGVQHQPNRGICSHLILSQAPNPTLRNSTFLLFCDAHVWFPTSKQNTSNSLVLRLSLHLEKKIAVLCSFLPSFPAELYLQSLFQLLSELQLPFPCSVEITEGVCWMTVGSVLLFLLLS